MSNPIGPMLFCQLCGTVYGISDLHVCTNAPRSTTGSALRAHPAAAQPVATDAELIEAFIAHNPQFLRSSDHPRWLSCKDGDGNWTSLRGDLFAASLRHLIESAK